MDCPRLWDRQRGVRFGILSRQLDRRRQFHALWRTYYTVHRQVDRLNLGYHYNQRCSQQWRNCSFRNVLDRFHWFGLHNMQPGLLWVVVFCLSAEYVCSRNREFRVHCLPWKYCYDDDGCDVDSIVRASQCKIICFWGVRHGPFSIVERIVDLPECWPQR